MTIIRPKTDTKRRRRACGAHLFCLGVLLVCGACNRYSSGGDGGLDGGAQDGGTLDGALDGSADGGVDASAEDRGVDDARPIAACGDGIVNGDEFCEPSTFDAPCSDFLPGANGAAGCTEDCTLDLSACGGDGICGDGTVDAGEGCDDGNQVSGDGCSADCQDEVITDCEDADGDGYGATEHLSCAMPGVDCDDDAPDVHPSATETCDGRDEDCDDATDEGLDDPMAVPMEDRCPSIGVCADQAINRCEDGRWICDFPADWAETECPGFKADCAIGDLDDSTCDDGLDNDCDGETDENSPLIACAEHPDFQALSDGEACFVSPLGVCGRQGGTYECAQVDDVCGVDIVCVGAALPEAERCERFDWDCDGHVANRNDRDGDGYGDCVERRDCDEGDPAVHPGAAELCNDVDDDCDGRVDEDALNACGQCGPPPRELCNGVDDDCNGVIDDIDPAAGNACGGCGHVPSEACNGIDDDCDGRTDEGVLNACGQCGPVPREVCNGRDDDCNGLIDDINPVNGNACGGCGPLPREVCNGADEDCDGRIDEGVANACGGCGAVPAEACNGADDDCDGRTDEGVLNACGQCGAVPAEVCDGIDNDCDRRVDEGGPADEPDDVLVEMPTAGTEVRQGHIGAARDIDTYDVFANEALNPDYGCIGCVSPNERTAINTSLRVPGDATGPYQLCVHATGRPSRCVEVLPGTLWRAVNEMDGQNCCNGLLCDQDNSTHFLVEVRGNGACSFSPYELEVRTYEYCVP